MPKKLYSIKKEIGEFYKNEFGEDLLFVIIYGSWAFRLNNKNSDVDMVGICLRYTQKQMNNTISFVKDLHKRHNLEFDEEVPYENKLLATPDFMEKSICGNGFEKHSSKIKIQPIVKTKGFLSSNKLAMRLLLNALTTKNIFCSGDYKIYVKVREKAMRNCVRIFFSVWNIKKIRLDDFVEKLIMNEGKTGQFYLGFDDNLKVRRYIKSTFRKVFKSLKEGNYLWEEDGYYFIKNIQWFKEINQKKY